MPAFRYRALDRGGATVTGTLEVPDIAAAAARLRAAGQLPVEIRPAGGGGRLADLLATEITPRAALAEAERIQLIRSLATLTGAGLALDRALGLVRDLGTSRRARAVAGRLLTGVEAGLSLSDAMDREAAAFPALIRASVRAGEAGATLEATLARLADQMEAAATRARAARTALIYPAFLMVTAIGSIVVLMVYVVPSFEPLLAEAGVAPPLATRLVLGAADLVNDWGIAIAGGLAALGLGFRLALARPAVRIAWDRARLRLPLFGPLMRRAETARLARVLGDLLAAGVALPAALKLAEGALATLLFRTETARVRAEVEAGRGLARPLAEGGLPVALALQLIRVGEESGRLAAMLTKTADIVEAEAAAAMDQALAVLTPALILIMGLLIALIVSSILFALLQINELAL